MIKQLVRFVLLWRRNDTKSILVKAGFFAFLAGFAVGMFTDLTSAAIAGSIAAGLAMMHYATKARREQQRLLEAFDGKPEALAAFRTAQRSGASGAMLTEFMRMGLAEMNADEEDDPEITDEDRARNEAAFDESLQAVLTVIDANPEIEIEDREDRIEALREEQYGFDYPVETVTILAGLLEPYVASSCYEDFCNDDDHANFAQMFATASQGAWQPENLRSRFDSDDDSCIVTFDEGESPVEWRLVS